jgi:hypothetical protein
LGTTRFVKTENWRKTLSPGLGLFSELGILRRRAYLSNGDVESLKRVGDQMEIAKIEVQQIASKLAKADPRLIGHEHETVYRCAILLLSALEVGNEIAVLEEFTGYSKSFVALVSSRMREAELWIENQVRCEHWKFGDEYCLDVEFWMDVLVAHGSWVRELAEMGEYSYVRIGPEPEDETLLQ